MCCLLISPHSFSSLALNKSPPRCQCRCGPRAPGKPAFLSLAASGNNNRRDTPTKEFHAVMQHEVLAPLVNSIARHTSLSNGGGHTCCANAGRVMPTRRHPPGLRRSAHVQPPVRATTACPQPRRLIEECPVSTFTTLKPTEAAVRGLGLWGSLRRRCPCRCRIADRRAERGAASPAGPTTSATKRGRRTPSMSCEPVNVWPRLERVVKSDRRGSGRKRTPERLAALGKLGPAASIWG